MVANSNTDITQVKITATVTLHNPDHEVPDFNKLSSAVMYGLDTAMEEGNLTPDDSTQTVESMTVTNIALAADALVVKRAHDAQMEEKFPAGSITDPRKFSELQVQALLGDIDAFVRFLPVEALNVLSGHLSRFMEEHGVRNDRFRELHDYANTLRADSGTETP